MARIRASWEPLIYHSDMTTLEEMMRNRAYQGEITNTPRNRWLGGAADFLDPANKFLDRYKLPESIPLLGGLSAADLTPLKGTQGLLDDASYGKSPIRGASLQTATVDPRLLDLAGLGSIGLPLAKNLGKAALREGARQIETGTGLLGKNVIDPRMEIVPNNIPKFPKTDGEIRSEIMPSQMSEFVPRVKSGDEMIVTHNTSPGKLYGADKLGGMPVPSLAISKISNPLEGFGDITFVGGREMAIPSKGNPVYKSDAYTKRRPTTDFTMDRKSEGNLKNLFGDLSSQLPIRGESELEKLINNFGNAKDNKLVQAKFLQEKGILPNFADYSDFGVFNQIAKLRWAYRDEYDSWSNAFMKSLPESGVNVKERIFNGYTPSGNRKYVDANLENTIKHMKGGPNTEGWNYGVGNLRAVATPKFKNFNEITKSRNRLISEDEFGKVQVPSDDRYGFLSEELRSLDKNYSPDDAMLEVAQTGNINSLDRIYKDIPSELKTKLSSYIDELKKMPTNYFEVKPQRSVGMGEFKGALVPSDLPARARQIIDKSGIKDIYTYANEEERKNLLKKFGKDMFSALPVIPAGGLLDPEAVYEEFRKKERK